MCARWPRDPGGESEALARIRRALPSPPAGEVWVGDDAAVLTVPGSGWSLLLAADAVVAGVDADLALTSVADLGWKAMAVNLSDLAAMGARPGHAVVTVVGLSPDQVEELYAGIVQAAHRYACPVVGGDLSGGGEVVVSVAVTGWADGPPVLRSGARPGHTVWVTGPLGAAAAGLRLLRARAAGALSAADSSWAPGEQELVARHARPRPALAEGAAARQAGASAMIDVSDGLAADLGQIAALSGVGLELSAVPVAPGATVDEALSGGDDYVLAFTLPPGADPTAGFAASGLPPPLLIGKCVTDGGVLTLGGEPLVPKGWEHAL